MTALNTGPVLLNNIICCRKNRNEITSQNMLKLSKTLGYVATHFSSLTKCTAATFSSAEMCYEHENFVIFFFFFFFFFFF